jgi:hypothetical protein
MCRSSTSVDFPDLLQLLSSFMMASHWFACPQTHDTALFCRSLAKKQRSINRLD